MTTKIRLNGASATMTRKVDRSTITDRFGNSYSLARSTSKKSRLGAWRAPSAIAITGSDVTIPNDGTVTIAAGTSSRYIATNGGAAKYLNFAEGDLVKFRFRLTSGTMSGAYLAVTGSSNADFVLEGDYYTATTTVPAGTPTISWVITNGSASDPLVLSEVEYAPEVEGESESIDAFVAGGYVSGAGNMWPSAKSTLSIPSGSTVNQLVNGITFAPDDTMSVLVRLTNASGDPAMCKRIYFQLVNLATAEGGVVSANVYLERSVKYPGLYYCRAFPTALNTGTIYARVYVDNGTQSGVTQTQEALTAEVIQMNRGALPDFITATPATWDAGQIVVDHAIGITNVYSSLNNAGEYFQYQLGEYDSSALSGGFGNDLYETYHAVRTSDQGFTPVARLSDPNGQDEFAVKTDEWGDFVGHRAHGRQERSAPPTMKIKATSGGTYEAVNVATRKVYTCYGMERVDTTDVYDFTTPTTVAATLVTTRRWEGSEFYLKQEIVFKTALTYSSTYLFMWSFYRYLDGSSSNAQIFDTVTFPDNGDLTESPGSAVIPATANDAHVVLTGPAGFRVEIDTPTGWQSGQSQRWLQETGSTLKEYRSLFPINETFHPAPRPASTAVSVDDAYTFETVVSISKPV